MGEPSYEELAGLSAPQLLTEVPGPAARAVVEADAAVTSPSLTRAYAFAPRRGAGAIVEDVDGNRFLDWNAGIAVCATGHAHPAVVQAVKEQADRLIHFSASDFYLPIYSELCARLDDIAFIREPCKAFLTNSGTEAVEAAIKLARYHTKRQYLIAFIGAFHGRSYGSVSLTASQAKYHQGFGPLLPGVYHAPYGAPPSEFIEPVIFKRLIPPDEVAAIFVEPIQGEGGYIVPPSGWLSQLRELCDRHGILLVADEIQSGMGRTGRMWAVEHDEVEPDILLVGKGIASGMPLGAMVARSSVMTWKMGSHGSTYGGNPLSCAAALVTVDLVEKELLRNGEQIGNRLFAGLQDLAARQPLIREVRGRGLMIGVELGTNQVADLVENACFRRGLLVLQAGDSAIRIAPPLVLTEAQAATGLRIFEEACAEAATARTEFVPRAVGAAGPEVPEGS